MTSFCCLRIPFNVELWIGGPVGVLLETFAHLVVAQYVKEAELRRLLFEYLHNLSTKSFNVFNIFYREVTIKNEEGCVITKKKFSKLHYRIVARMASLL